MTEPTHAAITMAMPLARLTHRPARETVEDDQSRIGRVTASRVALLHTPGLRDFFDPLVPEGESPYVGEAGPRLDVQVVPPDPDWPLQAEAVIARIRKTLGPAVIGLEHVGSTAVPGLPAKPVLDLDLLIADPDDEESYVPPLEAAGFQLVVREPWWYQHRMFLGADPAVNLHLYGPDSAESARQRLFRDWLREHPADRDRYAEAKRAASAQSAVVGEHVQQYNTRKEAVLREIYAHLFAESGLG
jgi:GrpB-like predicted nucleotidyltransferase (UPF0157 family)